MNCFPCFKKKDEEENEEENEVPIARPKDFTPPTPPANNQISRQDPLQDERNEAETENNTVKSFTFRELATATKNFRQECVLGEGGSGKVFKGTLQGGGQNVAVRQLDRNGTQAGKDFVFEVSTLSLLQHPNLVKMIGYCADGEQRLLVYEYLPSGSLKNYLFDVPEGKKPLDWTTRMNIALGIAEGLSYLHEKADPPIIYRDLKSSSVLLNEAKNPQLSDYGLAKLVQGANKMHVSVMTGFNGYCAPEYERNGELTLKSDVYSFGVVLLELITGRRALDTSLPSEEQSLVSWAQPIFKDPSKFPDMADPLLRKGFPVTSLNQAVGVAAMCLQEEPSARPLISDISAALSFLAMAPPEAPIPDRLVPMLSRVSTTRQEANASAGNHDDSSDSEDEKKHSNNHEGDDKSSSEYEDSSDSSDYEETSRMKSQNQFNADKPRCKSTKSKKIASSSTKQKTKKTVKFRGDSTRISSSSSEDELSFPSRSEQDSTVHQSHDDDSSSDEEHYRSHSRNDHENHSGGSEDEEEG